MQRDGRARPAVSAPEVSPFDVLAADFAAEAREGRAIPPQGGLEVALAGRSNVGKSTLLNAICQRRKLARVSRTPGCTRGVLMYDLRTRGGVTFRLVDLPGYGYADRSRTERRSWGPLIENYLSNRGVLRGVLILVDARRGPEQEEIELADFLHQHRVPFILVATKVDKLPRAERTLKLRAMAAKHDVKVFGVSGETGEGREALVRAMVALVQPPAPPSDVPGVPPTAAG